MTIKTLEYIHRLLLDDVETHRQAESILREAKHQEEDKKDRGEPNSLTTVLGNWNIACRQLREAKDALNDFESKEW